MAHLIPSSRSMLSSSARSRLCQSCSSQLSLRSVQTGFVANAKDTIFPQQSEAVIPKLNEHENILGRRKRAETWEGLEWVGSRKYIWENAKSSPTVRFAPEDTTTPDELESQLLCALVETLLVHDGSPKPSHKLKHLPIYEESHFYDLFPSGIAVVTSNDGPKLAISPSHRLAILSGSDITSSSADQATEDTQATQTGKIYRSWQEVPLSPLSTRFSFLKRIFQRTGHRIPDSSIGKCTTAGSVYRTLVHQREAARKLAEEIQAGGAFGLKDDANVDFMPRKVTRVDRDMSLGRWKITRAKLAEAGLPEFWKAAVPGLNVRRRVTVQPAEGRA